MAGADIGAGAAALAVQRIDLHTEGQALEALALGLLGDEGGGLSSLFLRVQQEGTNRSMGADQSALVAANAVLGDPLRHLHSDAALLILRSLRGGNTISVGHELAHGDGIAGLLVDRDLDLTDVVKAGLRQGSLGIVSQSLPGLGNVDLHGSVNALVDGGAVHVNDLLALLGVGLDDSGLHVLHGVLNGDDAGEVEEGSLQHGVGAVAQAQLHSDSGSVDGVEVDLTLGDLTLHAVGQVLLQLSAGPAGVQQEGAVRLDLGNDIEVLDVRGPCGRPQSQPW